MFLNNNSTNEPQFKIGLNGNYYVYCKIREPLVNVCSQIDKSPNSIYYNGKYEVWAIRMKATKQKQLLKKQFTTL